MTWNFHQNVKHYYIYILWRSSSWRLCKDYLGLSNPSGKLAESIPYSEKMFQAMDILQNRKDKTDIWMRWNIVKVFLWDTGIMILFMYLSDIVLDMD